MLVGMWPKYLRRLLPQNSAPMKEHESQGSTCHFTVAENPLPRDLIISEAARMIAEIHRLKRISVKGAYVVCN